MVVSRIEKDTVRLEAIRSIGKLLDDAGLDFDSKELENITNLTKELVLIKGRSLSHSESELVEEIIQITKEK